MPPKTSLIKPHPKPAAATMPSTSNGPVAEPPREGVDRSIPSNPGIAKNQFVAENYDNSIFRRPEPLWSPSADPLANQDFSMQILNCMQSEIARVDNITNIDHAGQQYPEVRLYGVTREGNSALIRVLNFEPYFWIEAPPGWHARFQTAFKNALNERLSQIPRMPGDTVVRVETAGKRSLQFHHPDPSRNQRDFLKIVVQMPGNVPKVREFLQGQGLQLPFLMTDRRFYFSSYESNVIFPLRFLVDSGVGGCNWITLKGRTLHRIPNAQKVSHCQIEVFCSQPNDITNHEPVDQWLAIAPMRILSFDIECLGRKGHFPEAERDPVIQIANYVTLYGSDVPLGKVVFTLDTCSPLNGAEVRCFPTEQQMLVAWAQFMHDTDPDFLTGYNISNFDMPYLLKRAAALNLTARFAKWSRVMDQITTADLKTFMSKQMGNREYYEVAVDGRVILDVLVVMQRDHKLRSYSLNSVSQHFLGEQKEDVHHSIISDLQLASDETRHRLAVYCLKDALLPLRLIDKLMIIVNNVEMARVTGVPIPWLLERGQQIKVFSQILRKARAKDLVFPTKDRSDSVMNQGSYEGATVISPKKGFYDTPIATLDFASLYPSIMMAHNLCYSTLVLKSDVPLLQPGTFTKTPSGDYFVKKSEYSGILPEILNDLLTARKAAKKAMNAATDDLEKAVLNGRQLALKISANSVYGFTGAQVGKLPCLAISASVTSFGREMIERTKNLVEERYPGTDVVYGDTDSVMIRCVVPQGAGVDDRARLEAAMKFGVEAAAEVTKAFIHPIKLEFEKVYSPFLLMNKKRYAGLLWTNPDRYDKLDAKGIETVRRDNCPLVASVLSGVLNRILIQKSVESAIAYVKGTISDLLMNRLDISQLVVSKAFSKAEDKYENKQAHIALVERMRKRDPASAPTVGDRVAYVIIKGERGAKSYEKSEDPIYVLEHNVPIDVNHYLDHFLKGPLTRVFEAVMDKPEELVKGEHTRHIAVALPPSNAGGLMRFVKIKKTCLGCKASVEGNAALCAMCEEKGPDIYTSVVAKRNHFETIYSRVWTQCQQCQGSLHQEVLCTAKDCPVFYMRKKVEKDLKEAQDTLDRFGLPVPDW